MLANQSCPVGHEGVYRGLRKRGAKKPADPQAELLARLSRGWLSPHDIGPGLSLLLAVTIELVSAFGPTVLSNYAEATECDGEKGSKAVGLVINYLAERIEPAANTETVSESALFTDHAAWCHASGRVALAIPEFVAGFDQLRAENEFREDSQTQGSLLRHPLRHLLISRDSG